MGRNGPRLPGPERRSTRGLPGCGTPSTTTPGPSPVLFLKALRPFEVDA